MQYSSPLRQGMIKPLNTSAFPIVSSELRLMSFSPHRCEAMEKPQEAVLNLPLANAKVQQNKRSPLYYRHRIQRPIAEVVCVLLRLIACMNSGGLVLHGHDHRTFFLDLPLVLRSYSDSDLKCETPLCRRKSIEYMHDHDNVACQPVMATLPSSKKRQPSIFHESPTTQSVYNSLSCAGTWRHAALRDAAIRSAERRSC